MGVPRFYRVLRGQRGAAAKQRYIDRLEGLGQGENVGTKGGRPESIKLYLEPFAADFPPDVMLQQSALVPSWTAVSGVAAISSRVSNVLAADKFGLKPKGFKAARVVRRTIDNTGTAATSGLTGLRYLKYNTSSISAPFGRANATDTVLEARNAIVTGIGTGYRVTFTDEDI